MSSIALNKSNAKKENMSLIQRLQQHFVEVSKIMAPGVFAMNNTYYRPAK